MPAERRRAKLPTSVAGAMRPARALLHVEALIGEALWRLDAFDETCFVVVDGDEVVGILPRHIAESNASRADIELNDIILSPVAYCGLEEDVDDVRAMLNRLGRLNALVLDKNDQVVDLVDADRRTASVAGNMRRESIESTNTGDAAGSRVLPSPTGELQVYTERPHLKGDAGAEND